MTNMKCPFLSHLIDFILKSTLIDIRIATPACFLGPFDWKNFFPSLYSKAITLFDVEVFLACSRRIESVFVSNLLACAFL